MLQILPPYELAAGESSPYGARTSFGLDPIYVALDEVEDLDASAIDEALGDDGARELERVKAAPRVEYEAVRALKRRVLRHAFERFQKNEWAHDTARARALREFVAREGAWTLDLALYVALRESHDNFAWGTWPEGERTREPGALAAARATHEDRILEHHYGQWIAHDQWQRARRKLADLGVDLMGDVPFVVGGESADVWSHAGLFRHDASLGAPPDAFAPDGQEWGLPPYDWQAVRGSQEAWLRARTRRAAELYDRFRLDHVVGYFRMFLYERGEKKGHFEPRDEDAQTERGLRELSAIREAAGRAAVIAEDLGVIPDFVRRSLKQLDLPGYRILPWERAWKVEGQPYIDPATFDARSVAAWSTHDTAPIGAWWGEMKEEERSGLSKLMNLDPNADARTRWRTLNRTLFGAGSELALVLAPELLDEPERINTPGTVGPHNWTYRLPQAIEDLEASAEASGRMRDLVVLVEGSGR